MRDNGLGRAVSQDEVRGFPGLAGNQWQKGPMIVSAALVGVTAGERLRGGQFAARRARAGSARRATSGMNAHVFTTGYGRRS
jgi:hypothetical protein